MTKLALMRTFFFHLDNLTAHIYAQGVPHVDLISRDYLQSEW